MDSFETVVADGGPFMIAVLVAAAIGAVVCVVLAVLTALGRRFPSPVWLAGPLVVVVLGMVGALVSALGVLEEIESGYTDPLIVVAGEGFAFSLYPDSLGMLCGALLLALSTLGGGIAAYISARHDSDLSLKAGLPPLILGVVVGLGLIIWAAAAQVGAEVIGVGLAVLLTGVGCGLGALRRREGEEGADEAAGVRTFLGLLAIAAAATAMVATLGRGSTLEYRSLAIAAGEERENLVLLAQTITVMGLVMGPIALAVAVANLIVPLIPLREQLRSIRPWVGAIVGLGLILAVAGVRIGIAVKLCELQDIADAAELTEDPPGE